MDGGLDGTPSAPGPPAPEAWWLARDRVDVPRRARVVESCACWDSVPAMSFEWWLVPVLILAGTLAGVLNVLAGGGSLLTLPILIFAGLPGVTANGTNRVAILMQNLVAVWRFDRRGVMPWTLVSWAAVPATAGSVFGARLALMLDDRQFQRVLVWIMVGVTLWTLVRSSRRRAGGAVAESPDDQVARVHRWALAGGFFFVGVYGGFVQAGVGFLILATLGLAGLDFVRGNAVKVFSVLCFTVVALGIFAWQGAVHWPLGLSLGVGNALGAVLGVRWTVLKGHVWLERFVAVTVIVFAVVLWVRS